MTNSDGNLKAEDDPFEIDEKDRRMLQVLVDHPDISNISMSKLVGMSPTTISRRKSKPAFVKAYRDLMATTDDLMKRAQKMAARRLLQFIKDPDKKIALEAMKMALSPLMNKHSLEIKEEVIFQTRIGTQGQLMQEVIEVDSSRKSDTSPKAEVLDAEEDTPNDNQDKP